MNRIRKNWRNKTAGKGCKVTKKDGVYNLELRTWGSMDVTKKEFKTSTGAIKFLESNGFEPYPYPKQPKGLYQQKVRAKTLKLGRMWFKSILPFLNVTPISKELGISEMQFYSWLENPQLSSDIDYFKFKNLRKMITGR